MALNVNAYTAIHQVLDGVLADGLPRPGARGKLFNALDALRAGNADQDRIRTAESVSIAVLRLEAAVRQGEDARAETLRDEIRALGANWLDTPIDSEFG